MGSLLSLSPPPAPPGPSKATQTEWNCPVCHTVHSDTTAVPCGHQFCLGCLLRHSASSPTCPQCGSPVLSAHFSVVSSNDFLQCILTPGGEVPEPHSWARRGLFHLVYTRPSSLGLGLPEPGLPEAGTREPASPEPPRTEPVERFPADLWAELLHGHEQLLEPVRPWLRQSLDAIYGPQWWEARQVESIALSTLCICGPDREGLTHMLQGYLGEYTAPLIQGLIHVTVHRCRDAWLQGRAQAAIEDGEQSESSAASAGHDPALHPAGSGLGDWTSDTEPAQTGPEQHPPQAWLEQHQSRGRLRRHRRRARPQEDTPVPGPSAPRRGRNRREMRRSHRRRTYQCRRPLTIKRKKLRRK
ncbi:hypothetical protein TURU_078180 [Turdus rufiventris]|nr:hypothetical protein TURU_078180 [Turdus rufiventris]